MVIYLKYIGTLFLLILTILFSACSHVVYPRGPIPVELDKVGTYDTSSEISLVNPVTESKPVLVATRDQHKYLVDFKQWTDSVVDQLKTELEKRGVRVKPAAERAFKVAVPNVRFFWGAWAIRCIVDVRVERSDGTWSKTYEGNNAGHNINRAIDGAVHKVIVAVLQDADFRNQISREYKKKEVVDKEKIVQKLEQLIEMRQKGLITEEEYQNKKREILEKF